MGTFLNINVFHINIPKSVICICSVSFDSVHGGRGVDQWGHSLNDPIGGLVDYKNWTKTARYSNNIFQQKQQQHLQKRFVIFIHTFPTMGSADIIFRAFYFILFLASMSSFIAESTFLGFLSFICFNLSDSFPAHPSSLSIYQLYNSEHTICFLVW